MKGNRAKKMMLGLVAFTPTSIVMRVWRGIS